MFNYVQGRQNHYTVTENGAKIMVIDRFSNLLSLVNTHNVGLHIVFKFSNCMKATSLCC